MFRRFYKVYEVLVRPLYYPRYIDGANNFETTREKLHDYTRIFESETCKI